MDPLIVLFGLGVGVLIGMTGIGGGSLMTPLLILAFGTKPVVAIGTDLAYGAITKTLGGWRHWRQRTVDLRLTAWLALGSAPGSLLGVWLIDRLHHARGDEIDGPILTFIAVALAIASIGILVRALFMPSLHSREVDNADLSGRGRLKAVTIGFALGLILGATSVGSGALFGLAMIVVFRLKPLRVVGTDVFHAAVLLWVAGFAHLVSGNVDFGLMLNILLGSLPGVWIGSHLATRVPTAGLRPLLAVVLLGAALGVLSKAGANVPPWSIAAVPLAVGALAWWLHRIRLRAAISAAEAL